MSGLENVVDERATTGKEIVCQNLGEILCRMFFRIYRPILMGSSAMASSSVAALLPFFFFEYHKNKKQADAFAINTAHAIYTPYPYLHDHNELMNNFVSSLNIKCI